MDASSNRAAQAIRLGLPLDSDSTEQAERILRKLDAAGFDVVPRNATRNRVPVESVAFFRTLIEEARRDCEQWGPNRDAVIAYDYLLTHEVFRG